MQVYVRCSSVPLRYCSSRLDPVITSFDGRWEHYWIYLLHLHIARKTEYKSSKFKQTWVLYFVFFNIKMERRSRPKFKLVIGWLDYAEIKNVHFIQLIEKEPGFVFYCLTFISVTTLHNAAWWGDWKCSLGLNAGLENGGPRVIWGREEHGPNVHAGKYRTEKWRIKRHCRKMQDWKMNNQIAQSEKWRTMQITSSA